jgi:hypothetical protein
MPLLPGAVIVQLEPGMLVYMFRELYNEEKPSLPGLNFLTCPDSLKFLKLEVGDPESHSSSILWFFYTLFISGKPRENESYILCHYPRVPHEPYKQC